MKDGMPKNRKARPKFRSHKHNFNIKTGRTRRAELRGYLWVEYKCSCNETKEKKEAE
jgi:hypothetical protein